MIQKETQAWGVGEPNLGAHKGLTVFTMSSWHQFLSHKELKIVFTITKEAKTVF